MSAATRQLQAWTPVFRLSPERGLLTVSRPCLPLVLPSWSGAAVAYLFVTADSPRQAVLSPGVGRPVLDVRVAHAVRLVLMRARLVPVSGSAGGSASRPAPLRTKGRLVRAPVVLGIITAVLQQALRVPCRGPGVHPRFQLHCAGQFPAGRPRLPRGPSTLLVAFPEAPGALCACFGRHRMAGESVPPAELRRGKTRRSRCLGFLGASGAVFRESARSCHPPPQWRPAPLRFSYSSASLAPFPGMSPA